MTTLRCDIRDSIEGVSYRRSPNTEGVLSGIVYGNTLFVEAYPRRAGLKEATSHHPSPKRNAIGGNQHQHDTLESRTDRVLAILVLIPRVLDTETLSVAPWRLTYVYKQS